MGKAIAALIVICLWGTCAYGAELTVSAAASLANAFAGLKEAFIREHPGTVVNLNFAASNPLLRQIVAGAPADIFVSADQETMDRAAMDEAIEPDSRRDFAVNDLVLVVPVGTGKPESLEDLTGLRRIAIGSPGSVPAGRYARAALTAAGLWEKLQPAFVQAANVRQALDYVARGEADAGFVYRTDALQAHAKVDIAFTVARDAVYPIAVCRASQSPELAREFVAFVLSPQGEAILARHGFRRP